MPLRRAQFVRATAVLCIVVLAGSTLVIAATDPGLEYAGIRALNQAKVPDELKADEAAKIAWLNHRSTDVFDRGIAFLQKHPTHPLRWDVIVLLRYDPSVDAHRSRWPPRKRPRHIVVSSDPTLARPASDAGSLAGTSVRGDHADVDAQFYLWAFQTEVAKCYST